MICSTNKAYFKISNSGKKGPSQNTKKEVPESIQALLSIQITPFIRSSNRGKQPLSFPAGYSVYRSYRIVKSPPLLNLRK